MIFNEHVNPVTNSRKLSRKIEICNGVKIREEKFGAVIFETLSEKIFITNETGGKILQCIEQGSDFPQIIDELKRIYFENPQIEKDTTDFIACLKENNFIVVSRREK